jgi:cell division protein FtsX
MAAYDDLNVKRIFSVGILSVVVTAVTALAVTVVYYWLVQIQSAETAAASNYQRQNQILEQQQNEIAAYGVDPQTGNIIIPIDKAIEQMVAGGKTESPADDSQANEDRGREQQENQASEET